MLATDDGTERYMRSLQGYQGVGLIFRLSTAAAGLVQGSFIPQPSESNSYVNSFRAQALR